MAIECTPAQVVPLIGFDRSHRRTLEGTFLSSRCAVIFPGQGSQHRNIREFVEAHRPDLAERAAEVVGDDPFARAAESTRFLQPAVYCASLSGWERYRTGTDNAAPAFFAGHSLGELAALVAAGSLDEVDGLRLVATRAELMERAARQSGGGMLAVVGQDAHAFAAEADRFGTALAGDNSPDQIVLSGPSDAIEAARRAALERGLDARRLKIAGAFHHASIDSVVPAFEEALEKVDFGPPTAPVFSGVTGRPFDRVRTRLAEGLRTPVRWRETALELHRRGVRRFVEAGPGHVLIGLLRRTLPEDVELRTMDEVEVGVG
jgi:malonyl CoA-acyl carrier protein transacylase